MVSSPQVMDVRGVAPAFEVLVEVVEVVEVVGGSRREKWEPFATWLLSRSIVEHSQVDPALGVTWLAALEAEGWRRDAPPSVVRWLEEVLAVAEELTYRRGSQGDRDAAVGRLVCLARPLSVSAALEALRGKTS